MGGCAAGGLSRHQQWSPSWILPRIRNQDQTVRNGNFCALQILATRFTFIVKIS